jgi:membrane-associated phospholipid phosphatase
MSFIFAIVLARIWFSAVYLTHHYVLDVLAGICCGITGIILFEKYLLKKKWFGRFMIYYENVIRKRPKEKTD